MRGSPQQQQIFWEMQSSEEHSELLPPGTKSVASVAVTFNLGFKEAFSRILVAPHFMHHFLRPRKIDHTETAAT